jgi:hypothetical protein
MIIMGIIICLYTAFLQGKSNQNTIRVGTSKMNITPTTPMPMRGYGDRTEPFKGVHDSLYVRTIVFSDGHTKAALISADIVLFSDSYWQEVVNELDIPEQNILLCATHTHGGPSQRVNEDTSPVTLAYLEKLKRIIVQSVNQASKKPEPATIGAGSGVCKMNINRRAKQPDGSIWLGMNPDGPCDHEVGVVRIDDLKQNPLAIWINWACHATIMRSDNYYITADWPGATAARVEQAFNKQIIAPVTSGTSGDINPLHRPKGGSFDAVETTGYMLGEEIIKVAKHIKTRSAKSVHTLQRVITLPGKARGKSRFPRDNQEPGPDWNIRLSVLKVGHVIFAGTSGEVMNEIGMKIKKRSPYTHTYLIDHCNGSSIYLVTDKAYQEGGYEVMATRVMSGVEQALIDNLLEMINQL